MFKKFIFLFLLEDEQLWHCGCCHQVALRSWSLGQHTVQLPMLHPTQNSCLPLQPFQFQTSPITGPEIGSRESRARPPFYCVSPGCLPITCFPKTKVQISLSIAQEDVSPSSSQPFMALIPECSACACAVYMLIHIYLFPLVNPSLASLLLQDPISAEYVPQSDQQKWEAASEGTF